MKYEIDGIEKGKTIKSVQVVNQATPVACFPSTGSNRMQVIMVDYLDGTQDVFKFNEETLKNIKNMVDTQAKKFVDNQKGKFPKWLEVNAGLSGSFLAFTVATIFDKAFIPTIIFAVLSFAFAGNAVRINAKNKNIKKHKIYVEKIIGKLEEYNEILKKENGLSKEPNKELVSIINIDKKSVKELEHIGNKIERYNEIEGKSPKKKTL